MIYRYIICMLILFFGIGEIHANNDDIKPSEESVDSLLNVVKNIYKTEQDSAVILTQRAYKQSISIDYEKGLAECNYYFGHIYSRMNSKDTSLFYFQEASGLYKQLEIYNRYASTENNIGRIYYLFGEYQNAYQHYKIALNTYQELHDRKGVSISLGYIGLIFFNSGDYDESIGFYLKSLDISEEINDSAGIAYTCGNLGNLFSEIDDINKAFEYTKRAGELFFLLGDERSEAVIINNLGDLNLKIKNYDEALDCFVQAATVHERLSNTRGKASCLNNIALIHIRNKDYRKALKSAKQAYKIFIENEMIQEVISSGNSVFLVLAKGYIGLQSYDSALLILKEGIEQVNPDENRRGLIDYYDLLYKVYEYKADFLSSNMYLNSYIALHDSAFNEIASNQVFELHESYSSERKERENQYLREEHGLQNQLIAKFQNQKYYLVTSVFLLSILIIYIGYLTISNKILGRKIIASNVNLKHANSKLEQVNSKLFILQADLSIANEKIIRFNKNLESQINKRSRILMKSRFMLARLLRISTGYLNSSLQKVFTISHKTNNHGYFGEQENISSIFNIVNESDHLLSKLVEINEIGRRPIQIEEIKLNHLVEDVKEERRLVSPHIEFNVNVKDDSNSFKSDYWIVKLILHYLIEISINHSQREKLPVIDIAINDHVHGYAIQYTSIDINRLFEDNGIEVDINQDFGKIPINVLLVRKAIDQIRGKLITKGQFTSPNSIQVEIPFYNKNVI